MAQKTNLNISPYYDDFDADKNYYKVLFKPGYPVQARELTTSQSILQNQIKSFGSNIFKDGSIVIPGGISYDNVYNSVKLKSSNFGIDITAYAKKLVGTELTGQTSGVSAYVKFVLLPEEDTRVDEVTIFVTYTTSGNDFEQNTFVDNEELICNSNITYGNTTINAGEVIASLVSIDATHIGTAAFVQRGVYFIRGYFVDVTDQKIILDPYTNNSSYRVGFQIDENIVNAKEDPSLYDNAKGFNNFASPGADRFQIKLVLIKKDLTDTNDADFVELLRVEDGQIKIKESKSDYNIIRDYMASRTYDESGDYSVVPFEVSIHNSLNNGLGNGGLYYRNDLTQEQNTPSDDIMAVKISEGKSYVSGYDVEKIGSTVLDIEKPRDVGVSTNTSIGYDMGNILKVNTVKGIPTQGSVIQLYDNFNATGEVIGSARVYNFNLEDAAYSNDATTWNLRLFDVQTYVGLGLNNSVSSSEIREGSYIKGKNTGASGYAISAGNDTEYIKLTQTSGTFAKGEQIEIDGSDALKRTIGVATAYHSQSVKSVSQVGVSTANTVLEKFSIPGGITIANIETSGGLTTARAGGQSFIGLRKGSIVRYQRSDVTDETYNKVSSIASDGLSIELEAISDNVSGVYDGDVPGDGTIQVSLFAGAPLLRGTGELFFPLAHKNISSIDLTDSEFKITKNITKTPSSNTVTIQTSDSELSGLTDFTFESFDAEKYSVALKTGNLTPQTLNSDTFTINAASTQIDLFGLTDSESTISLSLSKKGVVSKQKEYTRSRKLTVDLSKHESSGDSGGDENNSVQNGLTYDSNHRYGLRVEDEEISLNYPDVVKVLAIYEALGTGAPTLDTLSFSATVDVQTNAVIGENIVSLDGKVVARVVAKPSADTLEVIHLSSKTFDVFDSVIFEESNIETTIQEITEGKYKDITNSFTLDKGQRDQYYDYSRIIRNSGVSAPSRQLTIVFDHYTVPSSDNGDAFTVLSYDSERFRIDVPSIGRNSIRATDTIDFRPRVSVYDPSSSTISPFHYSSRNFDSAIEKFLVPEESLRLGYEYYLPRTDKLFLNKFGEFVYKKGVSSEAPKAPTGGNSGLMEIATINHPAYMYNPQSSTIINKDNKRYTMRDIGKIDSRVTNLEETTTLSLLELDTKSVQVFENGMDRFKTGFFVDPFKNYNSTNTLLSSIEINSDQNEMIPLSTRNSLATQLTPSSNLIPSDLDFSSNFDLFDSNVRKTGNAVTLNYEEVEWIKQTQATEVENVNPYEQPARVGSVRLSPESDFWTHTTQTDAGTVHVTGTNKEENINLSLNLGENHIDLGTIKTQSASQKEVVAGGNPNTPLQKQTIKTETTTKTSSTSDTVKLKASASDSITVSNTDTWVKNELTASGDEEFMRSRNTEFRGQGFPSFTKTYLFIDTQKPIFVPKLIEIVTEKGGNVQGSVGSFEVGEEVVAYLKSKEIGRFRICTPDHKDGAFNSPTEVYFSDPYSHGKVDLGSKYTSSTTVLNIDTRALCEEAQGKYSGYVSKGAYLVGQTSQATAYVKQTRLVSDTFGEVIGTFFIEDPYKIPTPDVKINTGTKEVILTTSKTNKQALPGADFSIVRGVSTYTTGGTFNQWEEQTFVQDNTTTINTSASVTGSVTASITAKNQHTQTTVENYYDPLAQTFVVGGNVEAPSATNQNNDFNGAFVTAVEVFFATIDEKHPVKCQIRTTTDDERPSRLVLGEKELKPKKVVNGVIVDNIKTSTDASVATKFVFDEPIYLAPGTSYAITLVAEKSIDYTVWIAKQGEKVVNSNILEGSNDEQAQYTTQYALGSLFRSQNGALWTEDQTQDMMFKLYKAKFTSESGSVFFNNPVLDVSNDYVKNLNENSVITVPKTGKLGIDTVTDSATLAVLSSGRKITGETENTTAVITGTGASTLTVSITEGGTNYANDSEVETFAITGNGSGLKLNLSQTNGEITSVTIVGDGGSGYQIGDVVGITTSSISANTGRDGRITIGSTGGINTLFLTNIQGASQFTTGIGLSYFADSTGTVTAANVDINTVTFDGGVKSGNYMKVNHFNHGMYSGSNKVKLSGIQPNTVPTTLSANMTNTTTGAVGVADTTSFEKFEGVHVSSTNPGYAIIENNEIVEYTSVTTDSITVSSTGRGKNNTIPVPHNSGASITKYELNGISLRRINNVVNDIDSSTIETDSYYVEIDRGSDSDKGIDRSTDGAVVATYPQASFSLEESVGGKEIYASENIMYNAIIPNYDVITPVGVSGEATNISASVRTTSGTSISGTEISFNDAGYTSVELGRYNALNSTRIVASKVNEDEYMTDLPRSKSFTTNLQFTTNTEDLSPIVYLNGGSSVEFVGNRLNSPIGLEDYSKDNRINSLTETDPHTSVYVSQIVNLQQPSSGLKVFLGAHRPESSDIRVLYRLIKDDSSGVTQTYELFPGYKNLDSNGNVINDAFNDGRPDFAVPSDTANGYSEYQFTANNLDEFTGFSIKIIISGTDNAYTPRIRDLRAIALA